MVAADWLLGGGALCVPLGVGVLVGALLGVPAGVGAAVIVFGALALLGGTLLGRGEAA